MGKVLTGASVSLDGYIAGPEESGFEHLFAWYGGGDIGFPSTHPEISFRLSGPDHAYLKEFVDGVGVLVVGRRLFDLTDGWGGIHPLDRPVSWSPTACRRAGCGPARRRRSRSSPTGWRAPSIGRGRSRVRRKSASTVGPSPGSASSGAAR